MTSHPALRLFAGWVGVLAITVASSQATHQPDVANPSTITLTLIAHEQASPQLAVVLTNTSSKPIRVWSDTCSWGYRNLSFKMTDPSGRLFVVEKVERGWEKNVPVWDTLAPGASKTTEVTFNQSEWKGLPAPRGKEPSELRVRALYQSAASYPQRMNAIWVGLVESTEVQLTIKN
jgi:hypothetical protein